MKKEETRPQGPENVFVENKKILDPNAAKTPEFFISLLVLEDKGESAR